MKNTVVIVRDYHFVFIFSILIKSSPNFKYNKYGICLQLKYTFKNKNQLIISFKADLLKRIRVITFVCLQFKENFLFILKEVNY